MITPNNLTNECSKIAAKVSFKVSHQLKNTKLISKEFFNAENQLHNFSRKNSNTTIFILNIARFALNVVKWKFVSSRFILRKMLDFPDRWR